jgi:hypothetical protein
MMIFEEKKMRLAIINASTRGKADGRGTRSTLPTLMHIVKRARDSTQDKSTEKINDTW